MAYIALPDPGRARINKGDSAVAARAVADQTGADPLLIFSNGPNDHLEFVYAVPSGDRTELRRIDINRAMPQRAAPELIADIYARTRETGSVHEALYQIFAIDAGERDVIPTNPTDIFAIHLEPLRRLYRDLEDEPATQTKRELWLDMLRGSGCAPDDMDEATDLFISHTLLVTIALAVIATMSDWERPEDPASIMAEGFAAWPQNRNERGPTHKPGVDCTRAVFHTANTYDWRPRTRDALRNIYQELIPVAQRKAFGEYYTPDWLAGMLADRIIDDAWLERAVARYIRSNDAPAGIGVLDPACGSGTFLYHAARRILNSAALQQAGATPTEQADFIAKMVNGIDIHPIAAEISRATLMRALPAEPANGSEALQIYQGDSLIYTHRGMELANTEGLPFHTLESRSGRYLRIPTQWAARPGFGARVQRFVAAANQGEPLPHDTLDGLLESDRQTLARTYDTLKEVIREDGDSVWAWYIFNSVSPAALKERKVDRILANPPWVTMRNIQVASRKKELEGLIDNMNLWTGKSNGSFDIGGLFVIRCREQYLRADADNRVAWVLNSAAIKGSNWERVRQESRLWNEEFLDFGELKDGPFTGAKSCALIQGKAPTGGPAQTEMANRAGRRVRRSDDVATARANAEIVAKPAGFPAEPAAYFTDGRPDFRNGATLFPHSLVKIARITGQEGRRIKFITDDARHEPWTQFNGTAGSVPKRYIRDVVYSDDLLCYVLRTEVSQAIIPLTGKGHLDPRRESDAYWRWADSTAYQPNRGKGLNTPKTLYDRINHQGALVAQIGPNRTSNAATKVIYNLAGQTLRAARTTTDSIADNSTFHYTAGNIDEASYLTAVLNADCLQEAYRQSRKSDRSFQHHIWRGVPIPRYDTGNAHHRKLASLCAVAEKAAAGVRDRLPADTGQIKLCDAIRQALRAAGISGQIDEQARAILPRHTTPAA